MSSDPRSADARITDADSFQRVFQVSRETREKLGIYVDSLVEWQRAVNLVAPATIGDVWHRHVADSAQIVPSISPEARALADLGSGAGFPGLVVAIMLASRPLKVTLLESDRKKCAFLRECARRTGISVEIVSTRIESRETPSIVGQVDFVTARALAPLDRLLALSAPYFGPDTTGLFLKGRDIERELQAAQKVWQFDVARIPSVTDPAGSIAVVRHLTAKTEE